MSIAAVVMLASIQYIEKIIEEIPKLSIKHTLEIFLPIPTICYFHTFIFLYYQLTFTITAFVSAALLAIMSISGE